ncbi:WD40 repeat domain-containing protein [Rodentibacter pneumotropicus]|uniref:WD40 repeat domain-containing protein n=1 Tax=Rodentibacter pneumotropicus TaxID=758 RepID=A0AAW5LC84_9PAST|nr:WD40 repeat domain-containing protein [Rodentibacter pneumotropicus]MCQ9121055.1 WD40 repeat domain-containing protein [Rodentibacter pneumotropicus]
MNYLKIVLLFILSILTLGCTSSISGVVSLGVSSDGKYAISAHGKDELVLWDLTKKEKKLLAKNVNPYSAYFIPDSHEFMWQDGNNVVHIQNVEGKEILQFPHFKTEGQIMSADKSFYLSADKWGKFYKGYGKNLMPIYTDAPISPSQTYTFSLIGDKFLSVGDGWSGRNGEVAETKLTVNPVNPDKYKKDSYQGVTLWDKKTLKPLARLYDNLGRTSGRISPDGKWVVAVSDNARLYMWSVSDPTHRIKLSGLKGIFDKKTKTYDTSKLLPIPDKFKDKNIDKLIYVNTVVFLSEKDFILFVRDNNELAPIYSTGDPWIQAYVEIGRNPQISNGNLSIASAYKANILVTGQYGRGGINVYKYHPNTKELEKIWVAD